MFKNATVLKGDNCKFAKLSDVMVGPILLYVSEIWGYENKKIIEQLHLLFANETLID
jgi:hypothetical protein